MPTGCYLSRYVTLTDDGRVSSLNTARRLHQTCWVSHSPDSFALKVYTKLSRTQNIPMKHSLRDRAMQADCMADYFSSFRFRILKTHTAK